MRCRRVVGAVLLLCAPGLVAQPRPTPTAAPVTPSTGGAQPPIVPAEAPALSPQDRERMRSVIEEYPSNWSVPIPPGTRLANIKAQYETRIPLQPARVAADLEDKSPIPPWFRAYIRAQHPELKTTGKYQYPRVAVQAYEWMTKHPDLDVPPPGPKRLRPIGAARPADARRTMARETAEEAAAAAAAAPARTVAVGTNVNVTDFDERNEESAIAVDGSNTRFVIAGSNNVGGSGRQKQFFSTDGGATWAKSELPLAPGSAFHSDPSVAFATNGTAFSATLGINASATAIQGQLFRSTDHGATWAFLSTYTTGNNNDKEMLWIDTHPTSPFKDRLYVVWDVPGSGMRFARSTDAGTTWSAPFSISTDQAIGSHVTTGPSGEVYVAWPDTTSREIRIRKSTDGGGTWGSAKTIVTTNNSYEISIPPMCRRNVLVYVAIGVDRSNGPRKGNVYAMWGDRDAGGTDPGCAGTAAVETANVYVSASTDGGSTWAAPKVPHTNNAKTDQFNHWMDVDPDDGTVHAMFYDTRDDPGRIRTNVYYIRSTDGGATWVDETKVTNAQTDETLAGADRGNQYGDYNGLAAFRGVHPVWTDRRTGVPGDKEQIFTATLGGSQPPPPPPCTFGPCCASPQLCVDPALRPGGLTIKCLQRPCWVVDPMPKDCEVKFPCPGCEPGGLCPPWYRLTLTFADTASRQAWDVLLYRADGTKATVTKTTNGSKVTLKFRPKQSLFKDGKVGDYSVVFKLKSAGQTGVAYDVQASLERLSQ